MTNKGYESLAQVIRHYLLRCAIWHFRSLLWRQKADAACRKSGFRYFLWRLLALANFMRLSLQKAAHANLADAACRKSGSS